jgi:hypothetical protein
VPRQAVRKPYVSVTRAPSRASLRSVQRMFKCISCWLKGARLILALFSDAFLLRVL